MSETATTLAVAAISASSAALAALATRVVDRHKVDAEADAVVQGTYSRILADVTAELDRRERRCSDEIAAVEARCGERIAHLEARLAGRG